MMRNTRLVAIAILAPMAMAAGACAVVVEPLGGANGSYDLQSANGASVPTQVYVQVGDHPLTVTITGGSLRLRSDGSFTLDLDYTQSDGHTNTQYTQGLAGTWSGDGQSVDLDYIDPTSGVRTSLEGFERQNEVDLTVPGTAPGTTVRTVFER